jgi:hypothetical protein
MIAFNKQTSVVNINHEGIGARTNHRLIRNCSGEMETLLDRWAKCIEH